MVQVDVGKSRQPDDHGSDTKSKETLPETADEGNDRGKREL